MKAGSANDRVDFVLSAILGHDAVCPHLANTLADHLDIGLGNGWIEVIGKQHALATHHIPGREFCPQYRVLHLLRETAQGHPHTLLYHARPVDKPKCDYLLPPIDPGAYKALGDRQHAKHGTLPGGNRMILTGNYPGRRAQE